MQIKTIVRYDLQKAIIQRYFFKTVNYIMREEQKKKQYILIFFFENQHNRRRIDLMSHLVSLKKKKNVSNEQQPLTRKTIRPLELFIILHYR